MTMSTDQLVLEIKGHHRERQFAMGIRKKMDNATLAYLRTQQGYRPDLPERERERIKAAARAAFNAGEEVAAERRAGKPFAITDALYAANQDAVNLAIDARLQFDAFELSNESDMRKFVRQLPVWKAWGKVTSGVGEKVLGSIVGECGDLDNYATPARLWKRLGLAVIDDKRQGRPGEDATKEDWRRHGYSGKRRSILFNFSSSMIKNGGTYRDHYDRIKLEEKAKAEARQLTVLPAADIKKLVKAGADPKRFMSVGHVDKRARRRVEKLFLKHLLKKWKIASRAKPAVPALRASNAMLDDAEREAKAA